MAMWVIILCRPVYSTDNVKFHYMQACKFTVVAIYPFNAIHNNCYKKSLKMLTTKSKIAKKDTATQQMK